jgi:hypothetical protein
MDIDTWLKAACADAERRGLTGLPTLLETLAKSTAQLRDADRASRRQPTIEQDAPDTPR